MVKLRIGRCTPGEVVTFTLDPGHAVDEAVEDDNVVDRSSLLPVGASRLSVLASSMTSRVLHWEEP